MIQEDPEIKAALASNLPSIIGILQLATSTNISNFFLMENEINSINSLALLPLCDKPLQVKLLD